MRCGLFLWILLAAGLAYGGPRYGVFIGHNEGAANEGVLRWAQEDATRMAEVFYRLGGIQRAQQVLLTAPTAQEVWEALEEVSTVISDPAAELVVYFSGHGDAESIHLGEELVRIDALQQAVEDVGAGTTLLILDACRSTRAKGAIRTKGSTTIARQRGPRGVVTITAAAHAEAAQESDALRGAFFSHHLRSALIGAADHNGDGKVSLHEGYTYAYHRTVRTTHREGLGAQHPQLSARMTGEDDLVLTTLRQGDAALASLRGDLVGDLPDTLSPTNVSAGIQWGALVEEECTGSSCVGVAVTWQPREGGVQGVGWDHGPLVQLYFSIVDPPPYALLHRDEEGWLGVGQIVLEAEPALPASGQQEKVRVAQHAPTAESFFVLYREGALGLSWQPFDNGGCAEPPVGFSVIRVTQDSCWHEPPWITIGFLDDAQARVALSATESTSYRGPFESLDPHATFTCVNPWQLDVTDTSYGYCPYIERISLVDCYSLEDCDAPAWDYHLQPPSWWPC